MANSDTSMEGTNSHHFLTVPAAICAYRGREYPRDASSRICLFCAGCRQSHHADAEALVRKLREHIVAIQNSNIEQVKILKARIAELEDFIDKVMDRFYRYCTAEGIDLLEKDSKPR